MEKEITVLSCDVCGKNVEGSYEYWLSEGWNKFKLCKDWRSGTHRGENEFEIVVCPKCNSSKRGVRHFFFRILKPFITTHNTQ